MYVTLISIISLVHTLFAHDQLIDSAHACAKPWPQLELWLPVGLRVAKGKYHKGTKRRNEEFGIWFFRSFFFFWPIETSKVKTTKERPLTGILNEDISEIVELKIFPRIHDIPRIPKNRQNR